MEIVISWPAAVVPVIKNDPEISLAVTLLATKDTPFTVAVIVLEGVPFFLGWHEKNPMETIKK